jgi:hypothetical protein
VICRSQELGARRGAAASIVLVLVVVLVLDWVRAMGYLMSIAWRGGALARNTRPRVFVTGLDADLELV